MMRRLSTLLLILGMLALPTVSSVQAATTYYLSDLTPTLANNGYGPYEKDRSNGEWQPGDGNVLTMQGSTWPKGLGTHAPSDLRYALGGVCQTFTAQVGVDDEIGDNGSIIFQVFADGTKVHDSGTMGGANTSRSVNIDVTGKNEIKLVVTDAGDGNSWDHGDWADAKVSCTSNPGAPAPTPTPPPVVQATPRLVKDYYVHQPLAARNDIYGDMIYRPNQFKAGLVHKTDTCYGANVGCVNGRQVWTVNSTSDYDGWDVLLMPDESPTLKQGNGHNVWDMTLTRPATVAIIKLATEEMPMLAAEGWVASGVVNISGGFRPNEANVYKKSFPAGRVEMPGPNPYTYPSPPPVPMYWVLLAEANGQPSAVPNVPSGKERPVPNQTCPAWVHDQYVTTAPNGQIKNTWHPQIDRVYWCYFRHEHGSDPALFHADYKPPYGYAADAASEPEAHVGFKSFLLPPEQGYQWYISQHIGTAGIGRACVRFHEMQVAVKQISTGEIVANLAFTADFGRSVGDAQHNTAYSPVACPNQQSLTEPTSGNRLIPRADEVGGNQGYEPWTHDTQYTKDVLGMYADFSPNTTQPIVICNTIQCSQPVRNALNTGTGRFMSTNGPSNIGLRAGTNTGTFYTDPRGRNVVPSGTTNAVKQYVKPGLDAPYGPHIPGVECYDFEAFGRLYFCGNDTEAPGTDSQEREGSLLLPDGSASN